MIANHIHDALAQVRTLQEFILERNLFKGYSGRARLVAGGATLVGTLLLASPGFPASPWAHLAGWGGVLALSVFANYAALVYWFLFDHDVRRNPLMLKPALDALPALGVGAALSLALILHGEFNLLFGVWMCLYGLAQVAYRNSMPRGIYFIGLFYLICGALCLLSPHIVFTDPRPMGLAFFGGEMAGGIVLIRNSRTTLPAEDQES
jgi:hypothetical protein